MAKTATAQPPKTSKAPDKATEPQDAAPSDPVLTFTEAGALLGKHRSTIARWVADGLIQSAKHRKGVPGVPTSEVNKILSLFQ